MFGRVCFSYDKMFLTCFTGLEDKIVEPPYAEKDIETARMIFQRAVEYFKIPDEPPIETVKDFIREDGTVDLTNAPMVLVRTWEDGSKFLNLAFFYDGVFTVLADYNPLPAILDFLGDARQVISSRFPHWTDEEKEKHSEYEAFKMTLILFSRIYPRMNLAMQNFISEVVQAWFIDWRKFEAQVNSESGVRPIPVSEVKLFRDVLKGYEDDLLKLWLDVPDRKLEEKKIQLAREYPSILKHWQKLRGWCRNQDTDWREYAKAGRFLDTPDDLLDKLENSVAEKTFHFALEHAARRAGLLKLSQDAKVLEKRAQQIKITGYTPRQLLIFVKEGEKLLGEMQAQSILHPDQETGEAKKSA
jgi:hypothetical protein